MYRALINDAEALARYDVSSLRYATAGSADVPADLLTAFEKRFGAPIGNGYGLTEGGPDVFIEPRWGIRKLGSLGPPLPGAEARIVDPKDRSREFAIGEVGEVLVRNPGVAAGYYKLPELTAARIRDGWLATGDLMRRDQDNYFYFVGRKDDMMNVGGENVYPKEVESVLMDHPGVRDVAVVSAPHATKGEAPVAFVVPRTGITLTEDEIRSFFIKRAPAYAHPRRVFFRETLPLSSTGKLDRTALEQIAREKVNELEQG
jgi:acyl-CoA synthetase (AMP-forming)/AMP-acid ligase II